jgi:hypothetical protein
MQANVNQQKEKFWLRMEYDASLLCDEQRKRLAEIVADNVIDDDEGRELMEMKLGHAVIARHRHTNIPQDWANITVLEGELYVSPAPERPRFSQFATFLIILIPALIVSITILLIFWRM